MLRLFTTFTLLLVIFLASQLAATHQIWASEKIDSSYLKRIWLKPGEDVTPQKVSELLPILEMAGQQDLLERAAARLGVSEYSKLSEVIKNCKADMHRGLNAQLELPFPIVAVALGSFSQKVINWNDDIKNLESKSYIKKTESPLQGLVIKTIFNQPQICMPVNSSVFIAATTLVHELSHYAFDDYSNELNFAQLPTLDSAILEYHRRSQNEPRAYAREGQVYQFLNVHFGLRLRTELTEFFDLNSSLVDQDELAVWVLRRYVKDGIYAQIIQNQILLQLTWVRHVSTIIGGFIKKSETYILQSQTEVENEFYTQRLASLTKYQTTLKQRELMLTQRMSDFFN